MAAQSRLCAASDRLSCLPDELLEQILTRIPLKEAVKTSILARRWRFMWKQIPDIIFDDLKCEELNLYDEDELAMNIYQVLLLHSGRIRKFRLSLNKLESLDYIDQVIYFVLKRDIKEFSYCNKARDHYKMPLLLFSCEQLKYLSLCRCIMRLPTEFNGFGTLVSLEFYRVSIYGEVCSSLICSGPLLKRLILKNLSLCDHLEIVAPNLRLFQCEGTFLSIHFKSIPRLESLSMLLYKQNAQEPVLLFDSLPDLQFLELNDLSFQYIMVALMGGGHNRLNNDLNHLKVLKLYGISFGNEYDAASLFSLIRISKNLEELTVKARNDSFGGIWRNSDLLGISFDHLKEVKMHGITGTMQELIFIEYILANSSKLLNMVIKTYVTQSDVVELLTKVTQFRRESRQAKITFKWW